MVNYNGKKFRPVQNSENGETSEEILFHYKQEGNVLTSEYSGGNIVKGHLIGLVDEKGNIDMRYQQLNTNGDLMTGICSSIPRFTADGKISLNESWQWTSGDRSKGKSVLVEV